MNITTQGHTVFIGFLAIAIIAIAPLAMAKELPVREKISLHAEPVVKIAGAAVIFGQVVFFTAFW